MNVGHHLIEGGRHPSVHFEGVVALDEMRRVAIPDEERFQLLTRNAREHRGTGDLVSVQMQDGQDGPVVYGIQELVRMPAGRERAGLRLAVSDDAGDDQVGLSNAAPYA